MSEIAIELCRVSKNYKLYEKPSDRVKEVFSLTGKKYSREKCVLDNLSLQIEKGDVVGIVGTNGAGKSTLLKIITGVLTPTSGKLEVNGKVAALLELGTGFNPEFTGIKNIFLNGTMMGFSREEMEDKLDEIIQFADIGDFIYQPVKTYSSGMFARLAFAVAINVDPEILIVDEALSVGDLRFQMKCMDKMKQMMDQGITVLFVSHDINAIRRLCTKTVWLRDGKNVEEFDIFDPVRIEIVYDVYDENIEIPVLGVALKRIDETYICGVNTMLDEIKIPWKHGRNYFQLFYSEGIRVLGGKYYFDVALFDKTASVPIHYWAKIKEFCVTAKYIGEGICIIPHEWRRKIE